MNAETAEILCKINNDFYRKNSASFSETRQSPWPGWRKCLEIVKERYGGQEEVFSVFDLACGNLRWEAFLASEIPEQDKVFYAVDNCDDLASCVSASDMPMMSLPSVNYQSLDVIDALRKGLSLNVLFEAPLCDLSVSFAFLHHVPLQKDREEILLSLIEQTKPGGYIVVSLWQFLNNSVLAEKAYQTHEIALQELDLPELDEGDFMLGWKNVPGAYRYCHNFSDAEIDHVVEVVSTKARLESRFVSDGRTANLNTYLVLRRA